MFDLRLLGFLSNLSAFSLFHFSSFPVLHFTIFWVSIGVFLNLNVVKASESSNQTCEASGTEPRFSGMLTDTG